MESSSKIIELSRELKKITLINDRTYLFYGSEEALGLYEVSINTLISSDNYDFDVVCIKQDNLEMSFLDDMVPLERFLFIDENIHNTLHSNLCQKLKKFIIDPIDKNQRKHTKGK